MSANVQNDLEAFDDGNVFIGLWINRSHGRLYGATLTLNRQNGGFLIAFLALYVSLTAKGFWKIARFILHSLYSSPRLSDGIYHQRQAILRNAKTAPDAVEDVLHVLFAWGDRARRKTLRLSPVLSLALAVAAGFGVAGVFSSRVTATNSNEVLLAGSGCATNITFAFGQESADFLQYQQRQVQQSLSHALQCYQGRQGSQQQDCETFAKSTLPYEVDSDANCPFSGDVCRQTSGNIALDTGYLDSQHDLGVNAEPRFSIRLRRHCAPLATKGFSELYIDNQTSAKYMRYKYGNASMEGLDADKSYIYQVPVNESTNIFNYLRTDVRDYRTGRIATAPGYQGLFTLIPELNRSDAETSLIFLSANGIVYSEKTEDPWFAATTPTPAPEDFGLPNGTNLYTADEPANVVGCAIQLWYCNPKLPEDSRCYNYFEAGPEFEDRLSTLWTDKDDLAAVFGFLYAMYTFTGEPDTFYRLTGVPSLLSRFTMTGPFQMDAIPPTRWQQEMEYSFQASLASFQTNMLQAAQKGSQWPNETICFTPEACQKFCHSQKIRSPQFYSFSILGVSIIIFLGLFLILVSAFLESIAACFLGLQGRHKGRGTTAYAMLEWQTNSALQLQRLVHEEIGLGTWSRTAHYVPVTAPGEKLGVLDISNPEHPRLQQRQGARELSVIDVKPAYGYEDYDNFRDRSISSSDMPLNASVSRYYSVTDDGVFDTPRTPQSPEIVADREAPMRSPGKQPSRYTKVPMNEND